MSKLGTRPQGGESEGQYRTAEVFGSSKAMFFTSIFYGSAVQILNDPIADGCPLLAASCFSHGCWHTFQSIVKKRYSLMSILELLNVILSPSTGSG